MNFAGNNPHISSLADMQCKELHDILQLTRSIGIEASLPPVSNKVPILNLSNVPDKSFAFFSSLFLEVDKQVLPKRATLLNSLSNIVPYITVQHPERKKTTAPLKCSTCSRKFSFRLRARHTCYRCEQPFCKDCPPKQAVMPRIQSETAEHICSNCLQELSRQDIEDWMKSSLDFIEAGTTKSTKAAMGCLMVALCLSDYSTKLVLRAARALYHGGLPEHAMPLVATVLQESQDTRGKLKAHILFAEMFKSMADENSDDPETQWNFLWASKDSINLALEQASYLDSGTIEIPNYGAMKEDVNDSLQVLRRQEDRIQELEIQQLLHEMEDSWQKRDCENLLALMLDEDSIISNSFLSHQENATATALELFLATKCNFLDRMLDEDRSALVFFQGLLKILKKRVSDGLVDIEKAVYGSHHHEWLREAATDVFVSLLSEQPSLLFPATAFEEALKGKKWLSSNSFSNRFGLLFPQKCEIMPPFARIWPELSVTGLNTKVHIKFEKAVARQVQEGKWNAKEVAIAYIDYVNGCGHPAEVALCFLHAAMWLLKHLEENVSPSSHSEVYATKQLIMKCLHGSLSLAHLRLHPGMQLYVSRLCLGTAMETMRLTESFGVEQDATLVINLLEFMILKCRLCPVWHFPSVPLSEAVLVSIKTGRFHQDFMFGLLNVSEDRLPMKKSELFYQIYENNLRYVCPLEDPEGAQARAMEEMLREKKWKWEDVVNRMTSPLSPRDSEGWLIQQPFLGVPMKFAELKGFSFDLDSDHPSIEIIAIPAKNSGQTGLFSMQDVQTVLQLDASDLYPIFFSLDPPDENQRFHPFQEFRYGTESLQKTPLLHTLFETDYLLKSFSVGAEVSAKPPFNQRTCKEGLIEKLPPRLQEAIKPVAERGNTMSNINRFWIQAEELVYEQDQVGSKITVRLSDLKMTIRSHPLFPGEDGKLQDTEHEADPDSPEVKFANDLTAHYNELGKHFPMFARLRELAKLQFFGLILRSLLDDMKNKSEGKEVEVPRELLTDIQQHAYQENQTKVDEILGNLGRQIGVWPAADNNSEISSLTRKMMSELPYHIQSQASYSDIRPFAIKALRSKDSSALSQVVDGFVELCGRGISRTSLESSVRQWLRYRGSATTDLKNLLCRYIPLPTCDDIKGQLINRHRQKFDAFNEKVKSVSTASPRPDPNPCKWVPAALLKEENSDSIRMCYGGVLIAPDIKSGSVPKLSRHARAVPVRTTGASLRNQAMRNTYQAPSGSPAPASKSSLSGGYGVSLNSRVATPPQANKKSSSSHNPILNTLRNNLPSYSNRGGATSGGSGGGRGVAAAASGGSGRGGGGSGGSGKGGGGGSGGSGRNGGGGGRNGGGDGRNGGGDGRNGGGGGRNGGGGGRNGGGSGRVALAASAAVVVVASSLQQDGSNPNKRMTEHRKQISQQTPFWVGAANNTIRSPKGDIVQVAPGNSWNAQTSNVIYGIHNERKGELVYVGQTKGKLYTRGQAHLRDIKKGSKNTDLVRYFNSGDNSLDDFRMVVLKVVSPTENLRQAEMDFVMKYDTKNHGANMRNPMTEMKWHAARMSENQK